MQDDKKEKTNKLQALDYEKAKVDSAVSADAEKSFEEKEQERFSAIEIEKAREKLTQHSIPKKDDDDDDKNKLKALKEADRLRDMQHEGRKIEHLIHLAEKKGVDFAIEVARKTNDSCLIDLLHDKIIEKGLSKDI